MIKKTLLALVLVVAGSFGSALSFASTPAAAKDCGGHILSLKPWYDGLTDGDCNIKSPGSDINSQRQFVWRIALNIVEDLLQVAGYVAVGYIIYGGFILMTSSGSPELAAKGRKTIIYAAIGLVIAIAAIGLVNLIADALGLPRG